MKNLISGEVARKGFTMIELTLVIVILGVLAAIAIPRLTSNREDAQALVAFNTVRDIIEEITVNAITKQGGEAYSNWMSRYMAYAWGGTMPAYPIKKHNLTPKPLDPSNPDSTLLVPDFEFNKKSGKLCVGIPIFLGGTYMLNDQLVIAYNLSDDPVCKRLTELLEKIIPENTSSRPMFSPPSTKVHVMYFNEQ